MVRLQRFNWLRTALILVLALTVAYGILHGRLRLTGVENWSPTLQEVRESRVM